jgi:anti-sigma regulatory factor (Ser/Thr protein kinase)
LSYVTCPNCGVSRGSAVLTEPPTTCPDCCARLHLDVALASPLPPKPRTSPVELDRVLLSGRDAPGFARSEFRSFAAPLGEHIASVGTLMVSEMVTNAVQHGPAGEASTIGLHYAVVGETLQVEISDDGRGFVPRKRFNGQGEGSGWGLHIVSELADSWGVDHGRPTRVWFELAV